MKSLIFFDKGKIFCRGNDCIHDRINRLEGIGLRDCLPKATPIPENYFNYDVKQEEFYDCLDNQKTKPFEGNWTDAFYSLKRFAFREGLNQAERDTIEEMHKFCSTMIIFAGVQKSGSMITGDVVVTSDIILPKGYSMPIKRWGFHEFLRHHEQLRKNHYFKQQNR